MRVRVGVRARVGVGACVLSPSLSHLSLLGGAQLGHLVRVRASG